MVGQWDDEKCIRSNRIDSKLDQIQRKFRRIWGKLQDIEGN